MANSETPVRLEVRLPGSRTTFHEVTSAEFMIGSVAGCDLVIPGGDLPPVLGVLTRTVDGPRLRKLAPNFRLVLNGKSVHHAPLTDGDHIAIGDSQIIVHVPAMAAVPAGVAASVERTAAGKLWSYTIPLTDTKPSSRTLSREDVPASEPANRLPRPVEPIRTVETSGAMRQLEQEADRLKQQQREIEARQKALDADEVQRQHAWREREARLETELQAARDRSRSAVEDHQRDSTTKQIELNQKERDLSSLKSQLELERKSLENSIREHREDLARMDRNRGNLELREAEINARIGEFERREKQIDNESRMLEERAQQLDFEVAQVQQDQELIRRGQAEMDLVRTTMAQRAAEVERQESMVKAQELRLDRTRDDINRLAQDLTTQKSRQDALDLELSNRQQVLSAREREINDREQMLLRLRDDLDQREADAHATVAQLKLMQQQLSQLENSLKAREVQLTAERAAHEKAQADLRDDLNRNNRFRESLDDREKQLTQRDVDLQLRLQRYEDENRALNERSHAVAASEKQWHEEHERLRQLRADLESNSSQLAERSATTEGAQAVVLAVRTKLERLRDELRREAENLTIQRARQDALDRELADRQRQLDARAAELESVESARSRAQQSLVEQDAAIRAATQELNAVQAKIAAAEVELQRRTEESAKQAAEQATQADVLRTKATELMELQQRIEQDRQMLADRETTLRDAESAREELERQLVARADEMASRQRECEAVAAELARRTAEVERDRHSVDADLSMNRKELDDRAAELEQLAALIRQREDQMHAQFDRLKIAGQTLAMERKARVEARSRWEEEQRRSAEELVNTRAELEAFRIEVASQTSDVLKVLPDLELRGTAALERLVHAREQLRNHVGELHEYARQSQDDLETLRGQVITETERLRNQQTALTKARTEHRHAVTAFRQQLIDWQGRVSEMKSAFVPGNPPLDQQTPETNPAAHDAVVASQPTYSPVNLHHHDEEFAQTSQDVETHLTDMRDWFRRKLKDVAHTSAGRGALSVVSQDGESHQAGVAPMESMTRELDPGDRSLGELLQKLELVDETTLNTLLREAQRQRRSLRQVLLASGKLTVYQMALIETGNAEGLSVGPLGVIDRLRVTAHESVYRVIDPRPGSISQPLVMRHVTESVVQDAAKLDDFRKRFQALTALRHPHVAATIEVLDIHGRPAVLQEWLTGITSADWPSLAASPGVWYRLTCQSLLGLATSQQAGFTHGGITSRSLVLTSDGLVKITGVGEPHWLNGTNAEASMASDLQALGQVAASWATMSSKRKMAKPPRPLPPLVKRVLDDWAAGRYESAIAVLDALDQAGGQIPAGTETWERLMKFAGDNATDGVTWRKSA